LVWTSHSFLTAVKKALTLNLISFCF